MRNFNDVVILSKNGVLLPAIVVKSQLQGDGVRSAPEQLDDVQGPVEPGDSDSPHAL